MTKKLIVLNCSPRKKYNTAILLKEAQKGAESQGAEVEYIDLYNVNFKGCISCFACKRKNSQTNGLCALKDDLRPILEKIVNSDAVIIGSPVYYSYATGTFRNLLERMLFAGGSYRKDRKPHLNKKIKTALIYTMNCTKEISEQYNYPIILGQDEFSLKMIYGDCKVLYVYDTYQFDDYSKYECDMFDEKHKAEVKAIQFPKDLENAFNLGKELVSTSQD